MDSCAGPQREILNHINGLIKGRWNPLEKLACNRGGGGEGREGEDKTND